MRPAFKISLGISALSLAVSLAGFASIAGPSQDHQRVALADGGEERLELGALRVLARGAVGEDAVELHLLELPLWVLVERADARVADPLAEHGKTPDLSG
jgi:hypothetical protein